MPTSAEHGLVRLLLEAAVQQVRQRQSDSRKAGESKSVDGKPTQGLDSATDMGDTSTPADRPDSAVAPDDTSNKAD